MWLILLSFACSGGGDASAPVGAAPGTPVAAPTAPAPASAPSPAIPTVDKRYVQASRLRMRPGPRVDPADTNLETLAINTPVRVLGQEGEWYRVMSPDGREGFVRQDFLAAERVTPEGLQQAIAAAPDDAARLALWQRHAALEPLEPTVLAGLAGAYRAVGDAKAAAWVERVAGEDLGPHGRYFPGQHADIQAITVELAAVKTDEALLALRSRAMEVASAMDEPLNRHFVNNEGIDYQALDALTKAYVPWGAWGGYAEGTVAVMELNAEVWTAAAARTEGDVDDRLLRLMVAAYGNPNGGGWATWQDRYWDYGGCSPFGNGKKLHLELLTAAQALDGTPAEGSARRVRQGVIQDVLQPNGPGEFPYCGGGSPTPIEGIEAEARAILAQIRLSDTEKSAIEARITAKFEPRESANASQ